MDVEEIEAEFSSLSREAQSRTAEFINFVEERSSLTSKNGRIKVSNFDLFIIRFGQETFSALLEKFENEYGVVSIYHDPTSHDFNPLEDIGYPNHFVFTVDKDRFKPIVTIIRKIVPRNEQPKSDLPPLQPKTEQKPESGSLAERALNAYAAKPNKSKEQPSAVFWIRYDEVKRHIILNDTFILHEANYESSNEIIFRYLYKEANQKVSRDQLIGAGMSKEKILTQIPNSLGFKSPLSKIFFDTSQKSITFYNPITKERFAQLAVEPVRISIKKQDKA